MSLVILVTYCSNERLFIDDLLKACLAVTDIVCVAVGRRLFDGREEDPQHIEELALRYNRARFVWFDVPDYLLPTPIVLHNNSRIAAWNLARSILADRGERLGDAWVLLLDGDEVPCDCGDGLKNWWKESHSTLDVRNTYKLSNNWFFVDRRLLSIQSQDSIVLVHGSYLTLDVMSHPRERDGICFEVSNLGGECKRNVLGLDKTPMVDHFSWVRACRNDLIAKVKNWGHHGQRDWVALINQAYDDIEAGHYPEVDFVHGIRLVLLPSLS